MTTIIGLFDLKDDANPGEYEHWARTRYAPVVRSLPSIEAWNALKASSVLGSETSPPYRYYLIIEADLETLGQDLADPRIQELLDELHEFADSPTLVVTEGFA